MPPPPAADEAAAIKAEAGAINAESDAGGPGVVIGRLADELLPLLIARLGQSSLGELEVRSGDWRVRLRRDRNGEDVGHPSPAVHRRSAGRADRSPTADRAPAAAEHGHAATARPKSLRAERDRRQVTAPAVGYYLPRSGLAPGTAVRAGDVIGHVDVLGVRQDVVVPDDGVLVSLAAEPGEAVEYGQVLARLEPGRGESHRNEGGGAEDTRPALDRDETASDEPSVASSPVPEPVASTTAAKARG